MPKYPLLKLVVPADVLEKALALPYKTLPERGKKARVEPYTRLTYVDPRCENGDCFMAALVKLGGFTKQETWVSEKPGAPYEGDVMNAFDELGWSVPDKLLDADLFVYETLAEEVYDLIARFDSGELLGDALREAFETK